MDKLFSSKDIAEVLEKRHDNLLRAIRKYCETLGEDAPKYFIPEGEGRKSSFNVTIKGCELLAGRMIGKAGDEFRLWYQQVLPKEDPAEESKKEFEEPELDPVYTVQEVAEALGMSERAVYRNIQQGKLEAVEKEIYIPTMKKFVTAEALEKFKAQRGA